MCLKDESDKENLQVSSLYVWQNEYVLICLLMLAGCREFLLLFPEMTLTSRLSLIYFVLIAFTWLQYCLCYS
jgi:hypothetical protein